MSKRPIEPIEELTALLEEHGNPDIRVSAAILGKSGDDRLAWDPRDIKQLKEARDKFYELLDKGYMAFLVEESTGEANKSKRVLEFEPDAGEIVFSFREVVAAAIAGKKTVMHPQVVGG